MAPSDELKAKGNAAFAAQRFEEAAQHFTDAIAVDPTNHVLYSNRSAAYSSLGRYEDALSDGEKAVEAKPEWPKGYSRKGAALHGLRRWEDAVAAYTEGLKLDPSNEQLRAGLADAQAALQAGLQPQGRSARKGFGDIFASPEFLGRLAIDARTRPFMSQPDFMSMLQDVANNPQNIEKYGKDERFLAALDVAMAVAQSWGPGAFPGGFEGEPTEGEDSTANPKPATKPAPEPASEPEVEMTDADKADAEAKAAANKEKDAGNEAYKKKNFAEAIRHYDRALELWDRDVSFLTNRAAVKFEQGDFEGCVSDCEEAIERGRELRADYKLIARAMTRKGNALVRQGDLEGAISVYNRSLTEHRNADTLKRLQEAEKSLKEAREEAYVDEALSAEEKEKGNAAFKAQRYPEAVAHYSEALKRGPAKVNPEAYKLFSNRAACYTKLGAWNEGMKDAEECIRLEPTFVKGYSRKGHLQFFMKEFDKAIKTYEEGLSHDPENAELKEGLMRSVQAINRMNRGEGTEEEIKERQAKGMADPVVQSILSDPVMRNVLAEMQEDPAAAQRHLKHPEIAKKIDKLIAAGVIQLR